MYCIIVYKLKLNQCIVIGDQIPIVNKHNIFFLNHADECTLGIELSCVFD